MILGSLLFRFATWGKGEMQRKKRFFARAANWNSSYLCFRCNSTPDEQRSVESDARARRALEIQEGVEATAKPEGYTSSTSSPQIISRPQDPCTNCHQPQNHTKQFGVAQSSILPLTDSEVPKFHSQDYYCHFLVPDLEKITSCCYYWGKMDRYEAEKLLDGKPEGTFLLRDSAQDDYLFSVSFRKYGRSLHARIEQWNHKFSFDSHDPSVYTAKTVTGLVEHYKDPTSVMFFEPMLTSPLHRNYVFSLQQLCRASIVSHTTYDGINELCLPATMKAYLKEYHYKLKIRVRQFPEGISNLTSS